MGGYKYFITFIDDFSQYGHIELIREKSESLDALRFSRQMLSSKRKRKLKLPIVIEVESIMGVMMKLEGTLGL